MFADLRVDVGIDAYTDASAAIGMVHRKDVGKLRHIDVSQLHPISIIRKRAFSNQTLAPHKLS